ncbi:OmpA/MotB family protein [Microbaculum marinisediminis]|uniref:Flagellar motor protein MotB n=1 Tax=Microbaculum marinisediminis TaxID=2931392 RepID=A0AAW5QWW7_9HYPH|nr:flagellar motor protein MotB [Microbaculum sp. A6E488]MCT8971632.1 flagellar motor protein MotB [Microbaculum sp. A6E488]
MARQKKASGTGVPEWMVTFGDLMALLACFFVLIISFSIQDEKKLQVVAGSMREAFGVRKESRKEGMIEVEGVPVREFVKTITSVPQEPDSEFAEQRHDLRRKQGPEANTHDIDKTDIERPRQFATAAASLRQAWQEMPEIMEISDQILVEETPEGLNIQLVDQEGRSMFPPGQPYPYERTRLILTKIANVLRELPNQVEVTGHTSADRSEEQPGRTNWDLSVQRANSVRSILAEYGVPNGRFDGVIGKAETDPLFPEDAFLAANRRISILLRAEEPPLPADHRP